MLQATDRNESGAWARRHNQALVALAREVWHDRCSLQAAYARICEIAASTLEADRVGVWLLDPTRSRLACIHLYLRAGAQHDPPGSHEVLALGSEYGARLGELRVIEAADLAGDRALTAADPALAGYLQRHGIVSMLDAPVRCEGEVVGVVCHEQVGAQRCWSVEDQAFAASIGDYVAMAAEIDRRREAEDRLRYLELHDPLTELPNRHHLLEVAHAALRPLHSGSRGVAAIHLQLEPGAVVGNDAPLLVEAAARLRLAFGDAATLARVREHAFALLPHGQVLETQALDIAERSLDLLQDAGRAVSVGIAFAGDLAAPSAETLLRNAELASQRARSGGQNRCEVFDAEHHRGLLRRLETERALREAMAEDRLEVWYQPEIDLRDGSWLGAEALLRLRERDGTLRAAQDFIDVAESSGLIVPIGRAVLERACGTARDWPARAGRAPVLRVNLSARQFEQPSLVSDVEAALRETGLPRARLCLELTETALLADAEGAARILGRLRALGVRIALDDFGTGWSSLGYLRRLPIDTIKLDRSFVAGLPDDRYDSAIVEGVAGISRRTGLEVVAEGVETQAQGEALRALGIFRAQGFLFAPALPNEELLARYGAG
ncbi:GGDEF and EAL domain-containing protein [Luteimonas sp. RD2P54]|uniref:GGDEF and EAL domain-containing protein n=1 Tax=Luteimonas endophytica TaxID=3042023 RepID=A0ABT6J4S3_9GAMM|nr:GGDEF and EAL domain-containing protein [Luteimonas endophytica]MDH5821821.1 GGDEF and EAL domain-containing protein [Luteimonas endophytica]